MTQPRGIPKNMILDLEKITMTWLGGLRSVTSQQKPDSTFKWTGSFLPHMSGPIAGIVQSPHPDQEWHQKSCLSKPIANSSHWKIIPSGGGKRVSKSAYLPLTRAGNLRLMPNQTLSDVFVGITSERTGRSDTVANTNSDAPRNFASEF